jgi:hypothetical protein
MARDDEGEFGRREITNDQNRRICAQEAVGSEGEGIVRE